MKNKNICKFITTLTYEDLKMHNFIYETDPAVMAASVHLKTHRAMLVKQGNGHFNIDGKLFPFSTGCLFFCFEYETVSVSCDETCEYMYIDFSGVRAERMFQRLGIHKYCRNFENFNSLLPIWHDSLSAASEENIDLTAESILLYTFSRLVGICSAQNSVILKIIEISEAQFNNSALSITVIANELKYNPKYLSHIFKEKMGICHSEYLRNMRIRYAISLFDNGIDSVKNVALLSGFTDPFYFSSVFKKTIGVCPTEYQKRLTKKVYGI